MVAVVSGNGLGLFNTSITQLGTSLWGQAGIGQSRESQYVNIATGNLILQDQDESLSVRGFSTTFLRTYNSQGTVSGAGQDGFVTGYERTVALTGSLNAVGSTLTLKTGDGQSVVFTYSGTSNKYVTTDGDGANDTMIWTGGSTKTWTYTEGSSQREETYADPVSGSSATGRLTRIRNLISDATTPAQYDVIYDGSGRVSEVRSVDGSGATADALLFGYDGSSRLTSVTTREGGATRYQVTYGYYADGRLNWVQTDLTPTTVAGTWTGTSVAATADNSERFRTTYTYTSATASDLRIASVTTSDGVTVAYTYDGSNRVNSVTQGTVGSGAYYIVYFAYNGGQTDVTDGLGRVWTYQYDANKQLTAVLEPAIAGQRTTTTYTYTTAGDTGGAGNVKSIVVQRAAVTLSQTDFSYDANGNLAWQWQRVDGANAAATAVQRTYNVNNQLLTETVYTNLDSDGPGATAPTGGLTTNFIYDSSNRLLRYIVDATGSVREQTYATSGNGIGQVASERRYVGAAYSGAYTESALNTWATATQKASSQLTEYLYDVKGRLQASTDYATVDAAGAGVLDTAADLTRYNYDAQGLLLQKVLVRGTGRAVAIGTAPPATSEVTDFVYDGMGRLLSSFRHEYSVNTVVDATTLFTSYVYLDSGNQLQVTFDSGMVRTQTRNIAGLLTSSSEVGTVSGATVTRTTLNYYDATGRLRATQDAAGARTYYFYDAQGLLNGQVDGTGAVTEYTRDGLGRLIDTIDYPTRVNTSTWLSGSTVIKTTMDEIRPVWSTSFDSLPIAGLDTTEVNNPENGVLTVSGGRLVVDTNATATAISPTIRLSGTHALTDNVSYSAEITTGATQSNTYLWWFIENDQPWGANYRRTGVVFNNGSLSFTNHVGTVYTVSGMGATQPNTTYVVETRTRNGRIEISVYVKGQDPSTGWNVGIDATPTEWNGIHLSVGGRGAPGVNGDALYLDNLSRSVLGTRHNTRTYDALGRLATETTAATAVAAQITTYLYDGASRLITITVNAVGGLAADARVTRLFYDNAGRQVATLDAAGYLTESVFDAGGRLVKTIRYATLTNSTYWASGTLAQLRPTSADADSVTRYFYDYRGQVVAELAYNAGTVASGTGYLTEYIYDELANQRAVKQYAKLLTSLDGSETLATLRSEATTGAPTEPFRLTQRSFNGLGQLVTELNAEGTVTRYSYDDAGRLIKTESAYGTSEVRENNRRYDVFGNLMAELTGEQSATALAAVLAMPGVASWVPPVTSLSDTRLLPAHLDVAFNCGTQHSYDLLGRRIETVDVQGNKTWYFYDANGRITFTVRGIASGATKNAFGEVTETRYSAFGQVTDTLAYTGRITIAGTQTRADAQSAINVLTFVAASDTRRQFAYDNRGLLTRITDAEGVISNYSYSSFGQLLQELRATGTSAAVTIQHDYDKRGLETKVWEALGQTYYRANSRTLDAFGRAISTTDGAGAIRTFTYDRLGRQVSQTQVVEGRTEAWGTSYDAFSRVVTQTDALGRVTSYAYSDANRTVTITTPELRVSSRTHNRFGQEVTVTNAAGSSTFVYDKDGALITSSNALSQATNYSYDARGLLIRTTDATGRLVDYTYDAIGRVLARKEDPLGLALTTAYSYDGQGRKLTVTDASGRVTQLSYDREGRLLSQAQDPAGLNLRTNYTWDAAGRQLTVVEGAGTTSARTTQYIYDALGRRTSQIVAPGVLNLTTTYTYDGNDNLVSRTEAGTTTRYVYDQANRLRFTVDPANGLTEHRYDTDGRLTYTRQYIRPVTLDAQNNIQTITADTLDVIEYRVYDLDGNLREIINGAGNVAAFGYDTSGRLSAKKLYANAAALTQPLIDIIIAGVQTGTVSIAQQVVDVVATASTSNQTTTYTYDAAGRVLRESDSNGAFTRYVYDGAGRVVYTITPLNTATRNWYDGAGRLTATRQYAKSFTPMTISDTSTFSDIDNQLAPGAYWGSADPETYYVYDASGKVRFQIDFLEDVTSSVYDCTGKVKEWQYDAAGRLVATKAYATPFSVSTTLGVSLFAGWATPASIVPTINASADQSTYFVYDAANSVTSTSNALGQTETYRYDAAGHRIATVDARGFTSRTVYNAVGRVTYEIDALGDFTRYWYDANGRVCAVRKYVKPFSLTITDATTATELDNQLNQPAPGGNWSADDRETYYVRDATGKVRFQIDYTDDVTTSVYDCVGQVTEWLYDAAGRVVETKAYATPFSVSTALGVNLFAGWALPSAIVPTVNTAADRASYQVYDGAGRVIYTVTRSDATQATVSERRYDGMGQLIADVSYGKTIAYDANRTPAQVAAAVTAAGGDVATNQRLTRYVYDADGQLRFSLDDAGIVTEQRYNATGEISGTYQYAESALPTITVFTDANLSAWIVGKTVIRKTTYTYDAIGQLKTSTDILNQVESYGYNALGQRISFTNKLNNTWNYEYDAAGRLTVERSPLVIVSRFDAGGTLVVPTVGESIVTRMTYDAFGNVLTRTENADAADVNERRTTQYVYDARGLQIKTIFPDAWEVNASGVLVAIGGTAPSIEITYDALGRAVVQKDVLGNFSYKVYDPIGRVKYDIDAAGYVTEFTYDAYGQQTGLIRYATKINTAATSFSGWTAGTAISQSRALGGIVGNSSDRAISTFYDMRGQKTQVIQSLITYVTVTGAETTGWPTTLFSYDAYGNLALESVLLDSTAPADKQWAVTHHYYDELGRKTLTVDAGGYVTAWTYDAMGQVLSQTEYARAISLAGLSTTVPPQLPAAGDEATGYDRTTIWVYDGLGRKTSETMLRRFATSTGGSVQRNVVMGYSYDAADHVVTSTVDGVATAMVYDALGRVTSVTESDRDVLLGTAEAALLASTGTNITSAGIYDHVSPYTTTVYDAFGNAVQVRRYANGWKNGGAVIDYARDQVSTTQYDRQGRAVIERQVTGTLDETTSQVVYRKYDAADHVTCVWYTRLGSDPTRNQTVQTDITYDQVGRQVSIATQRFISGSPAVTDSSEAVTYNAFGEVTCKAATIENLSLPGLNVVYIYDNVGNLTCTNAEILTKYYGYNLAGMQLRESHLVRVDDTVVAANTYQTVDKLGRVTRMVLPSNSTAGTTSYLTRRYDRWGNVLEQIDPRGYSTLYAYNDRNQMIRETRPMVAVLSASGVETWERPVYEYYYDAIGQLVGKRDANGHVQQNVYDSAGRLTRSIDALGQGTRQAYDAFGQNALTEDALGYLTYRGFDRLGRITSHGDYLADIAGTARAKTVLETYALDADGNRLTVTNALSQAQKYDYDSRGQLIRSQSAMGVVKTYEYDSVGRKVKESDASNYMTWTYDYHGRLTSHRDLGGAIYTYSYDASTGQMIGETSDRTVTTSSHTVTKWWELDPELWDDTGYSTIDTTQQVYSRTYTYYANGQVKQISDASNQLTYKYEYDAAGNRTMEESNTVDGQGKIISVRTRITYDGHNRIIQVTSDDLITGNRTLDVRYDYDAVGNRRRVSSQLGYGSVVMSTANLSPELAAVMPNRSIKAGIAATFTLSMLDYFVDPERAALGFTVTQANGSALPAWLTATYDASTGLMTFNADNTSVSGQTISIKVVASDGTSAVVSQTFNIITVVNTGPALLTSTIPTITLKQGQAVNLSLDALDYFAEMDVGDRLVLSLEGAAPAGLSATSNVQSPDRLWLTGTPGTLGTYSISVRATDASGAYVIKTITVQVVASVAPVAQAIPNRLANIGDGFVISRELSQVFTDGNGDLLTITAKLSTGAELPTWMRFTYEAGGTPPRLSIVGSVPTSATAGTVYTVVLTARDVDGNTVSTNVQITLQAKPTNTSSTVIELADQGATAGSAWSFTVPANTFTDANGDTLVYKASLYEPAWMEYDEELATMIHYPETFPDLPSWLRFDEATRTFTGTPPGPGDYEIAVRAGDGGGTLKKSIFILSIGAAVTAIGPAVAYGQPDLVVTRGQLLAALATFTDPNGGTLTYTARLAGGAALPSWLTIDPGTGYMSGTPPVTMAATNYTIEIVATDSTGLTAIDSFNVSVVTTGGGSTIASQSWYLYDAADRVTVVNGWMKDGQIVLGYAGSAGDTNPYISSVVSYGLGYDAMGRTIATYKKSYAEDALTISQSVYNLRGQLQLVYHDRPLSLVEGTTAYWGGNVEQQRTYDAAGRLIESRQYFVSGQPANGIYAGPMGWLQRGETFAYDADGRITQQLSYNRIKGWAPGPEANQTMAYQSGTSVALSASPLSLIATSNTNYDTLGRVSGTSYTQHLWSREDATQTGSAGWTHTFANTYEAREGYLEKKITGTPTNSNYRATTSTSTYDAYGRRVEVKEETTLKDYNQTLTRLRYFSYDAEGGILTRRDGELKDNKFVQETSGYSSSWDKNHHFVYANGNQIARYNEGGQVDAISGLTAYDQGGSATAATVQSGDTLESLSQRIYGTSSLWYVLAAANGLANNGELVAGTTLKVPNVEVSKNDASTFKPYNPEEIIGPTTPSLPYIEKPPSANCSAAMMIVMIVAIVVTAVVAPYLTEVLVQAGVAGAGAIGAFVGGFAGSVASQVVGKALGVVDHFSLRQAVGSGITDALTFGATKLLKLPKVAKFLDTHKSIKAAANAATRTLTSYAGSKIAGMEVTFSWKSVAASAVTAAITARVIGSLPEKWGLAEKTDYGTTSKLGFESDVANGLVGGAVGLHVRRAFGFDDRVDYGKVAADAFGNAIGNAIGNALGNAAVRGLQFQSDLKNLTPEQRKSYDEHLAMGNTRSMALLNAQNLDQIRANTAALLPVQEQAEEAPGAGDDWDISTTPSKNADGLSSSNAVFYPETETAHSVEVAQLGGHFYGVGLVGQEFIGVRDKDSGQAFSLDQLNEILDYSQFPDGTRLFDGATNGFRYLHDKYMGVNGVTDEDQVGLLYEKSLHALNGMSAKENAKFYLDIIAENRADRAIVGFALHGLVDVPFHVNGETTGMSFDDLMSMTTHEAPAGHGMKGSDPDYATNDVKLDASRRLLIQAFKIITNGRPGSYAKAEFNANVAFDNAISYGKIGRPDGFAGELQFSEGARVYMRSGVGTLNPSREIFEHAWTPVQDGRGNVTFDVLLHPVTPQSTLSETQTYLRGTRPVGPFLQNAIHAAIYIGNRFAWKYNIPGARLSETRFGLPLPHH